MESFGKYLNQERELRGISLEEISKATKISVSQLKALEHDDLAFLPATTFVKGFIRAYAKHIGIDGTDAVLRFEHYLKSIEGADKEEEIFIPRIKRPFPYRAVALSSAILIFLFVIIILAIRWCA